MYTNIAVALVAEDEVKEIIEVGCPEELSEVDQVQYACLMAKVTGSREGITGSAEIVKDREIIKGDMFKDGEFIKRPELRMTQEERIINGYDAPPAGKIVDNGKIREMTDEELVSAGLMPEAEYEQKQERAAIDTVISKRNARMEFLMSLDMKVKAELDPALDVLRKEELAALTAMTDAEGWPLAVEWPREQVKAYLNKKTTMK